MDFAYDVHTFNDEKDTAPSLSSLSTLEFTKKLQSLSLLGSSTSASKKKIELESINENSINRAKSSIELLDSLGFQYNPLPESNENFDSNLLLSKLNKILESTDGYDSSIKNSLTILENKINNNHDLINLTAIDQHGELSRRNLRSLLENDLIIENSKKLKNFNKIVKLIESIHPDIENLTNEYNIISNDISDSIDSLSSIKTTIYGLNKDKNLINLKKNILLSFKSSFTLSTYEDHLIRFANLNDLTTGLEFFQSIDKINQIQNNCDILLGMENEKLGFKILQNMNNLLILVNDKINAYVMNNIDDVYSGKTTDINLKMFQKCLIYLYSNNKSNFDLVISKIIESRSKLIFNDFLTQLKGYSEESTKSNNKTSTNLYMSSYDTVKFISDTLAYIHNLIVNETENSSSFFTFEFKSIDENLENLIVYVVNNTISSLNNLLKSSIENILRQENKLLIIINSFELIDLYSNMFEKLLTSNSNNNNTTSMINTMNHLKSETQDRIFLIINLKFKNLQIQSKSVDNLNDIDMDIIPDWLIEWNELINELFEIYNSNKNLDDNELHVIGFNDNQWNDLLNLIINKPVELLKSLTITKFNKMEKIIWVLNCVDYFNSRIEINKYLIQSSDNLKSIINEFINNLIDLQFNDFLKNSGLYDIYNLINMIFKLDEFENDDDFEVSYYQPITENKLFNIDTFKTANSKLENFLSTYINNNELNNLISPKIYNKVFFTSSFKFINFYKQLCCILNEYLLDQDGNLVPVFSWDQGMIATVLGVEMEYRDYFNGVNHDYNL